eukprot:UC4_evm1s1254
MSLSDSSIDIADLCKAHDTHTVLPCSAKITARIVRCTNLLVADFTGSSDPYVKLYLEIDGHDEKKTKKKTAVVHQNLDPVFNECFTYDVPADTPLFGPHAKRLHVTVWDKDNWKTNDFLGALSFSLGEILDNKYCTCGDFVLLPEEKGAKTHIELHKERSTMKRLPKGHSRHESHKQFNKDNGHKDPPSMQHNDFEYLKVLGRGAYGKVFLAKRKGTDEHYAIKALKKSNIFDDVSQDPPDEAFLIEKEALALSGPGACQCFLTPLVATFTTEGYAMYVMHFVSGGDLFFWLSKKRCFPEETTRFLSAEICSALLYLHSKGVVHRDIKLDNVMLDGEGHAK